MRVYSLKHLSDSDLLRNLNTLVERDRATTAAILAHIAEIDARKLYAPAGFPSMHAYCVGQLRLSEDAAFKRIQAARAARRFAAVFDAVAEGRVHLAGVCLLAPQLNEGNLDELLELATGRSKAEIEVALARRASRAGVVGGEIASPGPIAIVRPVATGPDSKIAAIQTQLRQELKQIELAPGQVGPDAAPEESYVLEVRLSAGLHAKLRYAQDLLSHAVPNGDLVRVLDRALDVLVAKLEKQKFAAAQRVGSGPKSGGASADRPRQIPAHVKRAVWKRDGSRCTFASDSGRRCESRRFLEFDHVDPVARGGLPTIEGLRLRCRTHNQMEAEQAFGAEFMDAKREAARAAAAERAAAVERAAAAEHTAAVERAAAAERAAAEHQAAAARTTAAAEHDRQVIHALHRLGVRVDEARRALANAPAHDEAPIEDRLRAALQWIGRPAFAAAQARGQRTMLAISGSPAMA